MSQLFPTRPFARLLWILFSLLFVPGATAQYSNGIYAEFNTSMGSFTCRLDYAIAPKAVANFIGLATGQRAWLDVPSGAVRTDPFYNGTTFHRVIAGFMDQGGSRNGLGTDGPGYQFTDEFTNTARFTGFGVLATANGGPDSNGSQYFITVSAQTNLNDNYTIFGWLYGGSNVVYAINQVATDANDKPLTNVMVQSVVIQRSGPAAQAFDISAQGLPVVTNLNCSISRGSTNLMITFSNRLGVESRFYGSTNLQAWSGATLGFETREPIQNSLKLTGSLPGEFFRMVQIQYPPTLYVPKNILGKTLTLNFSNGLVVQLVCDAFGGASYSLNGEAAGAASYAWKQDAYRGRLVPLLLDGYYSFALHLDYDSATNGTFKGMAYLIYPVIPFGTAMGMFTSPP